MIRRGPVRAAMLVLSGYCVAAVAATLEVDPPRRVAVEIYVAGPQASPRLCDAVRSALAEVSLDFRRQFAIELEAGGCSAAPEIDPGEPVGRSSLARFAQRGGRGRIVILAAARPGERYGLSDFRRGASAVSLPAVSSAPAPSPRVILEHELGHLFGAVHVGDRDSPMCPTAGPGPFDPLSHRLIGLLRARRFFGEPIPVPIETWARYAEALDSADDRDLAAGERDRSTMLVIALKGLGRDEDARRVLATAVERGESTPELALAEVREQLNAGGFGRIVRALSALHRLGGAGVETGPEREAAVAALARSAERAKRSADAAELEAHVALLDVEAPEEAALLRASLSIARGEPDEAGAWIGLAGSLSEAPYALELRCAGAVELADAEEARCRCGSAPSLSSGLLKKWADLAFAEGDYSSAASAWGETLRRDPRDALARQGRALAFLRGGNRERAVAEVEAAKSLGIDLGRDLEKEILGRRR